jgi:hypothetical protein
VQQKSLVASPVAKPADWGINQRELDSLEAKLQLIRDRVRGVATGWSTGFYLWGDGGVSKTYTVEDMLKRLKVGYKLTNSRLTGKGLFELLRDFPDIIHVLDDLETMLLDKNSHGVLRSALWGIPNKNGKMDRRVVWQIGGKRQEFYFTGGIIMIANVQLDQIATLKAMSSRISVLQHQPTSTELIALMRKLADEGFTFKGHNLTPYECHEVVDEVVYLSQFLDKPIDIRLFVNGMKDRLQFKAGVSETHWLNMLESRIKQRMVQREDVKAMEQQIKKVGKTA